MGSVCPTSSSPGACGVFGMELPGCHWLLFDLKGRHIFLALIYQLPTWSSPLRTEFHERLRQGLVPGAVAPRIPEPGSVERVYWYSPKLFLHSKFQENCTHSFLQYWRLNSRRGNTMAELYPQFFRLCILRQSFLAQACLKLLILLPQPL